MSAIHSLPDLLCPNHAQNKIQYLEKARQFMSRFFHIQGRVNHAGSHFVRLFLWRRIRGIYIFQNSSPSNHRSEVQARFHRRQTALRRAERRSRQPVSALPEGPAVSGFKVAEVSAPMRFCSFSPNRKCRKMAGKGVQPLDNYTCRFCLSSLKQADKSGLDRLQAGKLASV